MRHALRDASGKFSPTWLVDPLDPRGWDEDLPYRSIYLNTDGLFCIVDLEDYIWAIDFVWRGLQSFTPWKFYASRDVLVNGKKTRLWLHKEILKRTGEPPSPAHLIGDHMNGNSLDNRRSNLRWATASENSRNKYGFYVKQMPLDLKVA